MSGPSALEAGAGEPRETPAAGRARAPRILIVTAFFTPSRLIGARRPTRMARELKARGWDVTVLTLEERFMTPVDGDMRDPEGVVVRRTGMFRPIETARLAAARVRRALRGPAGATSSPSAGAAPAPEGSAPAGASLWSRMKGALNTWALRVEFPDRWTGWKSIAPRAVRGESFDVVLATIPPQTPALIAREIARSSGASLVLDYRDPWLESQARAALRTIGSGRAYRRLEALENELLADCALALGTSPSICGYVERRGARRVTLIRNSVDTPLHVERSARGGPVLYLGSLTASRRLDPLLRALEILDAGSVAVPLRLTYAGPDTEIARAQAARFGGDARVDVVGNVPHHEGKKLLAGALVGVVVVSPGYEHAIPGKVYEVVAGGCPILLIGDPASDAAAMVRAHGLGYTHAADDVEGIALSLGAALRGERPEPRDLEQLSTQWVADRLDQALRASLRR